MQRPLYDKEALDAAIADYMPEGTQVTYNIEEVPDQDWNQGWEDQGFEPIGVSDLPARVGLMSKQTRPGNGWLAPLRLELRGTLRSGP